MSIIDGDKSVADRLKGLLHSVGIYLEAFTLVRDFFHWQSREGSCCLVLETRLPGGINGLHVQRQLAEAKDPISVVFLTAHGDVAVAVAAMKAGAVDFFTKPFRDQDLLDAVHLGLERARARVQGDAELAELRRRFASLTQRERQVAAGVGLGMRNIQIADQIGISENTVKVHRARAMQKIKARSSAHFVQLIGRLNLVPKVTSNIARVHPGGLTS